MPATRGLSACVPVLAVLLWLGALTAGGKILVEYELRPGQPADAPDAWPAAAAVPLDRQRPTLVLIAHPRCPCTRATLGELAALMTQSAGRIAAHVVFVQPYGTSPEWVHSDLWRSAAAIPGVVLHIDANGVESRRFGSVTSGQALVYSPAGRLLFAGGITGSRGHAGDNAGRTAVAALVAQRAAPSATPVYGCELDKTRQGE